MLKNEFEIDAWNQNRYVCGIDEVGRGPLAGPVVTAACILPINSYKLDFIKDSKLLTPKKRLYAFEWLTEHSIFSINYSSHLLIDEINIYQATKHTMIKSIRSILFKLGNKPINLKYIVVDAMPINDLNIDKNILIKSFIKGESFSISIAAASILAKVARDRLMEYKISKIFPLYGFNNNKGYGTLYHREQLKKVGASIIHRESFIKKILKN